MIAENIPHIKLNYFQPLLVKLGADYYSNNNYLSIGRSRIGLNLNAFGEQSCFSKNNLIFGLILACLFDDHRKIQIIIEDCYGYSPLGMIYQNKIDDPATSTNFGT